MAKPEKTKWSDVKKELLDLDKPALVHLVRELFQLSAANQNYLRARLLRDLDTAARIAPYRGLIDEQFDSKGSRPPALDFRLIRKAIDDYRRATDEDVAGTLELMLTCLETAIGYANGMGVHYIEYFESLGGIFSDFVNLLGRNWRFYPQLAGRLRQLRKQSGALGWGYNEYFFDMLYDIEINLDPDA